MRAVVQKSWRCLENQRSTAGILMNWVQELGRSSHPVAGNTGFSLGALLPRSVPGKRTPM